MATLYRGEHFVLHHHRATCYVHLVRTEATFKVTVDVLGAVRGCEAALTDVDASVSGILLDWRLSPLSTDAKLHSTVVKRCDVLAARFCRRAVLLATAVGQMQAQRIIRTHSDITHEVFRDLNAAISHVMRK